MGLTVAEKLITASLVDGEMKKGNRIGIHITQTLTHDVTGVMTYLEFEAIGLKRIKTDLSVSYIDHNILQADYKNPDDHRFLMDITSKFGILCTKPASGICHQLHLERFAQPGKSLLGSDSHTVNAGGVGMLAIGAGGLDIAMAMAGEPFYFKMPQIIKVMLTGRLSPFVSAKNVILEVLRRLTVKGGLNTILEYAGPGIKTLNVTERATICNMGAEAGATTSVFPCDEVARYWFKAQDREQHWQPIVADDDAVYDQMIEINLSELEPLIALPHQPDNVVPVREVAGVEIDQVMFGGCTNSSLQDVLSIAHVLNGKHVHGNVDTGLYCGSRQVMLEAIRRGAIDKLICSGVRIMEMFCGACNGMGFAPPSKGKSLRTGPRNFYGRCGTESADVYLASPEVAAASAITGKITDPRGLGLSGWEYSMPAKFVIDESMFLQPQGFLDHSPVRRGPNIKPLPDLEAVPGQLSGETLIKVGDDITTDHIVPAGAHFLPIRCNIPEVSKYVFKVVDESFPERARKAGSGFIVAGHNYGQGSSREQAALAPRYLGIRAVIAKSFARIHLANLVNFGLIPFILVNEDEFELIDQGDTLSIDTAILKQGMKYLVHNITKNQKIAVETPLSQAELDIIRAGGRLNWIRLNQR
ncbi:aconitate hydratase [Acetonema longum]|uniref:Aconitate hydratase n=1 Tax=Acetonema longum DSM 6540 TaxID=1009370 RepID=F7NGM0_9FIRM|nr:aconitate hydratase [Acetonema longum]EGO64824.1 aconitate hydratase [Acetonema longum DSM 6540]